MLEKISNLFEDFLMLITQCAFWVFVLTLAFVFMAGPVVLATQGLEWLREGAASPRDGYWLYALSDCGEQRCRPGLVAPTEWVGVNRIANWIMDLHVAVYTVLAVWIGYGLAIAWADRIGSWKAREEWLRAPPSRHGNDDEGA